MTTPMEMMMFVALLVLVKVPRGGRAAVYFSMTSVKTYHAVRDEKPFIGSGRLPCLRPRSLWHGPVRSP